MCGRPAGFDIGVRDSWKRALESVEEAGGRPGRRVIGIDASATLEPTVDQIRSGEIPAGSRVLSCHLGGQPALSAYASFPGLGSPARELSR
jgi:1-aminocyclopropane-1-carboxylate deaminase